MKDSTSNSSTRKQSNSPQSSSQKQPAISDLRNQVTIVSQNNRTAIGDKASALFGLQIERISIPLPFVAGEFQVTEFFTQGGMSTTYLGHKNTDPTERVIIKIPDVKNQKTVEMFRNECLILSELKHPNVVPILGYGDISIEGESYPYMAMKFIDGQSLRQKIKAQGHLSWEEASKVLKDILEALNYLCEKKFCHRDIKPDNIIYDTKSQKWILVDFGIAKSMQESIMLTMTMAGQDSGTWDYMPPEQLDGKAVDIRCDIYALGTVIWESLIGTVPRRGTKLPAAFGLELPLDVDILIGKMVEHNPDDRYQTPSDVLKALHSGAGRIELWNKTRRKIKILTRYGALAAVAIILLVATWLIGNFVAIAKAKEVYEEHKGSATIALRELNKEAAKYPFYWGKTYVEQKRSELLEKAKEERDKMEKQYLPIKEKNDIKQLTDEELDKLKTSCENFVAVWENIFTGSEEIAFAQARNTEIAGIQKRRSEQALVKKTKEDINQITKTKLPSDYQKGFDLYRSIKESITESDLKADLDQFALQLKKDAIGESLEEVQKLIVDSTPQKWLDAKKSLEDIQKVLGDDPQIKKAENDIDENFWQYYLSRIPDSLKNNQFAEARGYLDDYEKYSYNRHSSDVKNQRASINNSELNHALDEVNKLIRDSSPQNWLVAKSRLEDVQRVLGADPRINNAKNEIDNKFWTYYSSRISESLRNNRFSEARSFLGDYEKYSYNFHSSEVGKQRTSITNSELNHAFDETNKVVSQYIKDNAYDSALNALTQLEIKYPNTSLNSKIAGRKKEISNGYVTYIIDKRTDIDSYQENFKKYLSMFPSEKENIKTLKRFLCWSVHNAVKDIVFDDDIVSQAKSVQLAQIRYSDCEETHKTYLKELLARASNYVAEGSTYSYYAFLYHWQRPPSDCVRMTDEPNIVIISIDEVKISLSRSHYSALQGMNNCNPEVKLSFGYSSYTKEGPENTYSFSFNRYDPFYFDVKSNYSYISVTISDADGTPFDAEDVSTSFSGNLFQRGGTQSKTYSNGSSVQISWTTR